MCSFFIFSKALQLEGRLILDIEQLGNEANVEDVINFYATMVYRLAYSFCRNYYNADDIFQEVFLRYFKNSPVFESEEHRRAWLIRVTINCAKSARCAWFRRTVPLENQQIYEKAEEVEIDIDLKKLSPKYRAIIHLFYYEELSIKEISVLFKQKESTTRTQLTRARRQLKTILEDREDA